MTQRKQIGWTCAIISLVILGVWMLWPEPWGMAEIRIFGWAHGVMWLLAVFASVVAGRMLSPRWYYLTVFWVLGAVTLGLVIFCGDYL
jgi:hypothetical protein